VGRGREGGCNVSLKFNQRVTDANNVRLTRVRNTCNRRNEKRSDRRATDVDLCTTSTGAQLGQDPASPAKLAPPSDDAGWGEERGEEAAAACRSGAPCAQVAAEVEAAADTGDEKAGEKGELVAPTGYLTVTLPLPFLTLPYPYLTLERAWHPQAVARDAFRV
jgi:hypothetical protein